MVRAVIILIAAALLAAEPVWAAEAEPGPAASAGQPPPATRTGKERLGRKWSDEQRADNCKVPPDLRGAKPRPETCPSEATQ